ncbi:MAG TPA: CinA family nicotinamide mononucleotide deamidase-related protein [Pirellulales bacterium]|nr:CinA family nicotinamide mononucleotide deamidase-related protein [Pirellulales bacterium]
MHAEVISIGDELTSGQRLDTNSQWLSTRLGELGVSVLYHTTVADNLDANVQVFRQAAQRVDIVVATGGLGPTADDLTRDALAAAAGVELVLDPDALAYIESLFARRKRPMPERNKVQAMFPRGSRVIPNPAGTAPGIDLELPGPNRKSTRIFALPGVPAEMREMWDQTVAPAISALLGSPRVIRHKQIKCFGVGESDLEAMLPDLIRRGREPQVGITVHGATITLRITTAGNTAEDCYRVMKPTIATIHECLGDLVFGEGDDELEHAVMRLLHAQRKTLATAEWGSGGMISHWLAEVPASAEHFLGGVVVRNSAALTSLLGIQPSPASSPQEAERMVREMAQACREKLGADYGLALGQLPTVGPQAAEPPLLYFAVAGPHKVSAKSSPYAGHPEILKTRGGKQALNLLRLTLLHAQE